MNTEFRVFVAGRLREEREKLGLSQGDMAELGGTKSRTYQDWERAIAGVSTEFLALAALRGLDVTYVLTGVRGNTGVLSPDESTLVERLRNGSPVLRGYLQEMGGAPSDAGNTVTIGGDVGQSIAGDQVNHAPVSFTVGKK